MLVLSLGLALAGCSGAGNGLGATRVASAGVTERTIQGGTAPAERLRIEVLSARPHDPEAYTQGLVFHEGYLYESTGLEGRSSVRQVDPQTGAVLRRTDLEPRFFGEGLARIGNRLTQITWQNRVALVYDLETFERLGELPYEGEGWGLCFDGERLVMSDGSSTLTFRNPETFEVLGTVPVTLDGRPLERLN
jgi:glutamine cyclotransferase